MGGFRKYERRVLVKIELQLCCIGDEMWCNTAVNWQALTEGNTVKSIPTAAVS